VGARAAPGRPAASGVSPRPSFQKRVKSRAYAPPQRPPTPSPPITRDTNITVPADHEYTCGLARPDQRLDERESLERLAKARIIGEDAPAERTVCDTVHPFNAKPLVTLQTPRQLIVHHSQAMCRAEHAPLLGPSTAMSLHGGRC
jgi:hypothetical protein